MLEHAGPNHKAEMQLVCLVEVWYCGADVCGVKASKLAGYNEVCLLQSAADGSSHGPRGRESSFLFEEVPVCIVPGPRLRSSCRPRRGT